ncbi:Transcription factor himD [Penicillium diatomitis]|uniref:Transcription factor himD n=1 Tax=Penicillium diatomitis TaxID=2819901 RepID=A0A9X0BP37_9EURO|nr:Transcription factor himD [Penicillium diatomitis]KAJ5477081.1 Transcription factor himD [Penicillium diatomitis]
MSDISSTGRLLKGSARTCQNCARAKIRCVRSSPGGSCDRCGRLGKACHFQPGRRPNGTANPNTSREDKINALEAKLDRLLAQSVDTEPPAVVVDGQEPSEAPAAQSRDVIDQGYLTLEAADRLLHDYKTTMMPYCPFVPIPSDATAASLRKDKPFLFLTILTTALHDNMPLQRKLEVQVKRAIGHSMIHDGPVTCEMLQGILVHLAWCQYHARPRRVTQYLHLGISIITDLQLDRDPADRFWKQRVGFDRADSRGAVSWGNEERRAVIGYFWFSSCVSQILQKRSSFPWVPYLEASCEFLASNPEYECDRILSHIVELQRLYERVAQVSSLHKPDTHHTDELEYDYRQIRTQLDLFRSRLPFVLNDNEILFMQFYAMELYICQILLFDVKPDSQHPRHNSPFQVEILRMGLAAARTMLEFWTSLPLRREVIFNNTSWTQLGFAVTLACKLVVAASEPPVRPLTADLIAALNLSNTLSRCILRMQALVTAQMDAKGDRDVFYHYEKRLKQAQWWFESRALSQSEQDQSPANTMDEPSSLSIPQMSSQDGLQTYYGKLGDDFNFQWPGFFPTRVFEEYFAGWPEQESMTYEETFL